MYWAEHYITRKQNTAPGKRLIRHDGLTLREYCAWPGAELFFFFTINSTYFPSVMDRKWKLSCKLLHWTLKNARIDMSLILNKAVGNVLNVVKRSCTAVNNPATTPLMAVVAIAVLCLQCLCSQFLKRLQKTTTILRDWDTFYKQTNKKLQLHVWCRNIFCLFRNINCLFIYVLRS